ncbi:unnamed protein product [Parnassius apollo]|uniref:(apollo) hypothetical protein n=1 Tax=Parnassius apollo TaxID=110799 RepID=A0A8S3XIX0_PARAO|nr:unnamed protein product [Parnassius apollo]
MSNVTNQNGTGLEQQLAGLDLQPQASKSTGRYIPPHLRRQLQANTSQGFILHTEKWKLANTIIREMVLPCLIEL